MYCTTYRIVDAVYLDLSHVSLNLRMFLGSVFVFQRGSISWGEVHGAIGTAVIIIRTSTTRSRVQRSNRGYRG